MKDNFREKYIDISNLIQKEFERNVDIHGSKIRCSRGCSKCCHQIFKITAFDAFIIRSYMHSIPDRMKNNLRSKAAEFISNRSSQIDFSVEAADLLPCPALGKEGECSIYEARPVICRRFGPPMYDYKKPDTIHSCDLNFSDGDEIQDSELIPCQTTIGKKWDSLKTEFNLRNNLPPEYSTTIAEAILNS